MISDTPSASLSAVAATTPFRPLYRHTVSWPAIFAGVVVALAMEVLFVMLGAGLGFAIYHPIKEANPVANLGEGAVFVEGVSAIFSLWFGGWVAGRFTPAGVRATGWLHGFSVWCAATVVGVAIVSTGAGWATGSLGKIAGGGLSLAGKPAAALAGGASEMARDGAKRTSDTITSFVDEAMGDRPAGSTAGMTIRAKREVGLAVARLFDPTQHANLADNRAAAVKALVEYAGMSEADANQTVAEWTATYDRLRAELADAKSQAEMKARELANEASKDLAVVSLCAFFAFVLGALAATFGGRQGAQCAAKRDGVAERAAC